MDELDYEDLRSQVNSSFRVNDTPLELTLVDVTEQKLTSNQEMFSLIFCGAKDKFLDQGSYDLTHETLSKATLFLVPIGQDENGYQYEAAFNRLRST